MHLPTFPPVMMPSGLWSKPAMPDYGTNEDNYRWIMPTVPILGGGHQTSCVLCGEARASNDSSNKAKHAQAMHQQYCCYTDRAEWTAQAAPAPAAAVATVIEAGMKRARGNLDAFVAVTGGGAKATLDTMVAIIICLGLLPLSFADNIGFRFLLLFAKLTGRGGAQAPDRARVGKTIRDLYKSKWEFLMSRMGGWLGRWGRVSLQLDGWSSLAKHGYLGVTMQFMRRSDFKLVSFPLALRRFPGSHTNERTREVVGLVWSKMRSGLWSFAEFIGGHWMTSLVISATTDNGANVVRAFEHDDEVRGVRATCDKEIYTPRLFCRSTLSGAGRTLGSWRSTQLFVLAPGYGVASRLLASSHEPSLSQT